MAFWKRRSQSFDPVSPQTRYTVTYLGHEELKGKVGLDNTLKPVDDMYRQFKSHKSKPVSKMDIEVMNNGIKVEPLDAGVRTMFANSPYFVAEGAFGSVFFPINKLSFGAADPYHNKIFCFVSRNENPAKDHYWDCHAVFCESSAMAKNLTLYLVKAFQRIKPKDDPIGAAQKSKRPTTVHILRERGTSEHQVQSRRKKRPPVSTVSVTLNLEGNTDMGEPDSTHSNRAVADIIAQRAQRDLAGDVSNGNSVSKEGITSSSDKENDVMEGISNDEELTRSSSAREVEVTVAFNPDLSSPPESPRKSTSPRAGRTSSGDEDDVVFELDPRAGETSPQDMITTMSPPDTPGYQSKEVETPSLSLINISKKPPSPQQQTHSPIPVTGKSKEPSPRLGNSSSRKQESVLMRQTAVTPMTPPDSPRESNNSHNTKAQQMKPPSPTIINSQRQQNSISTDNLRRNTPSPSSPKKSESPRSTPSPVSTPPLKSSPPRKDGDSAIIPSRRRSPQSTMTSATTGANSDDSVAVQKKSRKERKSVRFASDPDLIS